MNFQPNEVIKQLRNVYEAEGKEVDESLLALLEVFIINADPKSLEESQEQVREFLKYVEFRENADKRPNL